MEGAPNTRGYKLPWLKLPRRRTLRRRRNASGNVTPISKKSIPDATDIELLWFDPALGDGITNTSYQSIVVGKPKDFFRTVTDPNYRRQAKCTCTRSKVNSTKRTTSSLPPCAA